jgi:hypothetical protein
MIEAGPTDIRAITRAISEKDYNAFLEEAKDRLRYQVEFAQGLLRNLLLVNGGAVLALLTTLGNTSVHPDPRGMWWAFFWFGVGLFAVLAAYFAAFFSQLHFYNASVFQAWNAQQGAHDLEQPHSPIPEFNKGNLSMNIGIIVAIIGVSSFLIGSFVALEALLAS